jgi:calcium-dependent protein kinase
MVEPKLTRDISDGPVTAATFIRGNSLKGNRSFDEDYKVTKVLGTGTYGEVRLCKHLKSGEPRAVKIVKKDKFNSDEIQQIMEEVVIHKKLDHPNIVKIHEYFEDQNNFYIVQELCEGGMLFDHIINKGHLEEKCSQECVKVLAQAIAYINSFDIAHRDIKPENILLDSSKHYANLKLIDFGCSKVLQQASTDSQLVGTPFYIAPEVLRGRHGKQCDVWSIGVIAFILLCGDPPFYGESTEEIEAKIRIGVFSFDNICWQQVSAEAQDFIAKTLVLDVEERMTIEQCL